jgi:hypothetical protein
MDKRPQEALDAIRQQLQMILMRAELWGSNPQCERCADAVCEIVKEIRTLESFVRSASDSDD